MDLSDFIINIFTPQGFGQLMGWLIVVLQAVYLLFAFITVRQVSLMNRSFSTEIAPLFSFIAYVHFLAALLILVISIVLL
jgi:hypothetical protein